MTELQRWNARMAAISECIALVRDAVAHRRAHLDAIRNPTGRPDRLPDDPWRDWYERAEAAVAALEGDDDSQA